VLLDALMPGMDGFAVAQAVAAERDLAGPVVMMLSSADRQEDAARCRELGLAAYLVKPLKADELYRAIGAALGGEVAGKGAGTQVVGRPAERRLRVLLAEDNAVNQRVAVRMLRSAGHSVAVANDGRAAVAAAERGPFDAILMDVQMPEMD